MRIEITIMVALLISLLFLVKNLSSSENSFTGPRFSVGDCMALSYDLKPKKVETDPLERWETPKKETRRIYMISRVEEIGTNKYRTSVFDNEGVYLFETSSKISYDDIREKVECPKGVQK